MNIVVLSGSPRKGGNTAIAAYKAMSSYLKWEDMGIVTVPGMAEKGDMAASPRLADVRALGASL